MILPEYALMYMYNLESGQDVYYTISCLYNTKEYAFSILNGLCTTLSMIWTIDHGKFHQD